MLSRIRYDAETLESTMFSDEERVGVGKDQLPREWMHCWDAIQQDLQAIVEVRASAPTDWTAIEAKTNAFAYGSVLEGRPLGQQIVIEWERLLEDLDGHGGGEAARLWLAALRDRALPSSAERNERRKMWPGGLRHRREVNPGAFPELLDYTAGSRAVSAGRSTQCRRAAWRALIA